MPNFRYRAAAASGEVVEGVLEAADRQAAVERLFAMGYTPLRAEPDGTAARADEREGLPAPSPRRPRPAEIAAMTRQLATLVAAGVELDRALTILIDVAEGQAMSRILPSLQRRLHAGMTFAQALEAEGAAFPRLLVSMVRAGEASGSLDTVLARLADHFERALAVRESIKSALVYPLVLLTVSLLSIAVLGAVVLPRFAALFNDMDVPLPLLTRIVLGAGTAAADYGLTALALLAVAVFVLGARLREPKLRQRIDYSLLRLPLVGALIQRIEVARFARALASLLGNGVPMVQSLGIAREVIGNRALSQGLEAVEDGLRQGMGLARPLAQTGLFPRQSVHMVRVGEETGELPAMLERLAESAEGESRVVITRLLSLLEPALILGLGCVVAVIVIALLSAILAINDLPV